MREHKYRVWDEERKRMVTKGLSFSYDYESGINSIYDEHGRIIEEPEVMDWISLKDKNKKKIYDGDIVRLNGWEDYKHCNDVNKKEFIGLFLINVNIGVFGIDTDWESITGYACPTHIIGHAVDGILKNAEVIGNVYEDPKLLEEKKR